MTVLECICILILGLYSLMVLFLALGLLSFPAKKKATSKSGIKASVVVPFRDERSDIPGLIGNLAAQHYPTANYEVILVNDHSKDGSPDLVREFIAELDHFRCLDLPPGYSGKKAALALGVEAARNEWIIQTDADCRLGKDFLSCHMARRAESNAELVAGWVLPVSESSAFLSTFELLDVMALSGAGAGSFSWGRPLMCSGANMAFTKALYRDTRSMDPVAYVASGDDMFLLIGARKLGRKIVSLPFEEAAVHTRGVDSWSDLLRQRMRWGGKSVHYRMPEIQAAALLVFLAALCTLLLPFLMLAFPENWPYLAGSMMLKMLADFLLLYLFSGFMGRRKILWKFLPVWVVYQFFLAVAASASLLLKESWKGTVS